MTEEEIIELQKSKEELEAKIAKSEQDKTALVGELTAKREEARLAKEKLEKLEEAPKNNEGINAEELVERALARREQEDVKGYFEAVKEEFKRTHQEFSDDKDPAGILFKKYEAELKKFNLDGIKTKEGIATRFKEAYRLMNGAQPKEDKTEFYSGHTNAGADIKETDGDALSAVELSLIKEVGWTKEKYLEQKANKPAFISQLLQTRSI